MNGAAQTGFCIMSRPHGANDWRKRNEIHASNYSGNMPRTYDAAEMARSTWAAVEPQSAFKVVPWYGGDSSSWTIGYFNRKI
jgi:hypothetical protein